MARGLQRPQRLGHWARCRCGSLRTSRIAQDAASLYDTLEDEIIPLFYERDPKEISHYWIARVRESMKTIIPRFSTRRMVKEYVERLYVPALK